MGVLLGSCNILCDLVGIMGVYTYCLDHAISYILCDLVGIMGVLLGSRNILCDLVGIVCTAWITQYLM